MQAPLLDVIRAEQHSQHARRMALLDDPATQARIALAEDLADELEFAGFHTMQQQIFHVEDDDDDDDVSIFVHVTIHEDHAIAGTQALVAVLARRGGHLSDEGCYSESGRAISLRIHLDGVLHGWLAAPESAAA